MGFGADTTDGARRTAREISREGAVLLKNDGGLFPIRPGTRVALFGRTQADTVVGGTGSANLDCEYMVTFAEGLRNAGVVLDESLAARYAAWVKANPIPHYGVWGSGLHCNPEMPVDAEFVAGADADVAVVILWRSAGENEDMAPGMGDWELTALEENLLQTVTERFGDRTAVVFVSGGIMDFSFLDRYHIPTMLHAFFPGMEGANAIGDLIAGNSTPSGKMTSTVAYAYEDYPSAGHFGQKGGGILQDYVEDIFVGYRYFLTFAGGKDKIRFPFGYGLSYTDFRVETLSAEEQDGAFTVTVRVTNTGDTYAGKEVVQVYATAPGTEAGAKLEKPARVLVGFAKTELLSPGESQTVEIRFDMSDMASFDDTGVTGYRDSFLLEEGYYGIYVGTDSLSCERVLTWNLPQTTVLGECCHLDTALSHRMRIDGTTETLDAVPDDPMQGLQIASEGKTRIEACKYCKTDAENLTNLSELPSGMTVTYRLDTGASGGYRLSFDGADAGAFADVARLWLAGVEQTDFDCKFGGEGGELLLPAGVSELTVGAKDGKRLPPVTALVLEKIDRVILVGEGTTDVSAASFYECAYGLNIRHFANDGTGKPISLLSNFWTPGKFVSYKLNVKNPGIYDLTLRLANCNEDTTLADACSLFVSNVGQNIAAVPLPRTSDRESDTRVVYTTQPVQIALPAGECYFKLVSAVWQFADIDGFSLCRSAVQSMTAKSRELTEEETEATHYDVTLIADDRVPGDAPKEILLADVYAGRRTMEEFLAQFSVEELAGLVSGDPRSKNENGISGCFAAGFLRYGIPPMQTADGPLGLRIACPATAYPSGSALASSWNPDLAERFGTAVGCECVDAGVDVWLAPGVNIYRDPRCGRNFEYYAEDPLLSARMASGVVRGVQKMGASVCVKHFVANNTEHERLKSDSRVSARALREIYLKNFERILTEGNPWCMMSSYNHVNHVKASEQRSLITAVAREEWGWDGVILSDWGNDSSHVKEVAAGQEVKMAAGDPEALVAAVADGTLTREDLLVLAKRILCMIMKTESWKRTFRETEPEPENE